MQKARARVTRVTGGRGAGRSISLGFKVVDISWVSINTLLNGGSPKNAGWFVPWENPNLEMDDERLGVPL